MKGEAKVQYLQKVQKGIAVLLVLLLLSVLTVSALADETMQGIEETNVPHSENVAAAAVYNLENDMLVYSHNVDAVLPTASFTKMMTAVCAYELLSDRLDEKLTVEYSMIKNATGNQVGYYVGETVSVRDLFGGLLLRGANDSAYLLCYAAKGSVEDFVAYMNEKAQILGMYATVYKNPTGMDAEGMVTSAADSIKIAKEFYAIEFLTALSSAVQYSMPATEKSGTRIIYNRNALVSKVSETGYFDSRILGINAGSTVSAGYYAASAVSSDTLQYMIVVLGGKDVEGKNAAYQLTSELATYALTQYGYTEVIKTTKIVCEVPVRLSTDADYVTLVPADSLMLYLPSSLDVTTDLTYSYRLEKDTLDAPVTEGQVVGTYTVSRNGEVLGSVDLVAKNSLARSEFLVVLDRIEQFTKSTFFIATVLAAVVLTILYFIIGAIVRASRRRRGHVHTRRVRRR